MKIIVFSTVTTTFLDAYSAGVSSESLSGKINGKLIAVAVTVIATVGAIFLPLTDITDFLYFIGSVFAPMIAIQIADFFILKRAETVNVFHIRNLLIWLIFMKEIMKGRLILLKRRMHKLQTFLNESHL